MNSLAPVIAAGATFATATLLGVVAGAWLGRTTGQPLWVLGGLAAGLGLGAYSAARLLRRSL